MGTTRTPVEGLAPGNLGARGQAFWDETAKDHAADPGGWVLLVEACRAIDRLEQLYWVLSGDPDVWMTVTLPRASGDDAPMNLLVDNALIEARLQAGALRQLLGQLGLGQVKPGQSGTAGGSPTGGGGGEPVDQLAAIRSRRGPASADPRRTAGADT